MIDEVWIKGTQRITNARIKKAYPLMSDNHFSKTDVRLILESYFMLLEEWNEVQRAEQSDNRDNESR